MNWSLSYWTEYAAGGWLLTDIDGTGKGCSTTEAADMKALE